MIAAILLVSTMSAGQCSVMASFAQQVAVDRDKGIPMVQEELNLDTQLMNIGNYSSKVDSMFRGVIRNIYTKRAGDSPDKIHDDIQTGCEQ